MKTLLPILCAGAMAILLAACATDGLYSGGSVGRFHTNGALQQRYDAGKTGS